MLCVLPAQLPPVIAAPGEEEALGGDGEHVIPSGNDVGNADVRRERGLARILALLQQGAVVVEVGQRPRAQRAHSLPLAQLPERVGAKGPHVALHIEEDGQGEASRDVETRGLVSTLVPSDRGLVSTSVPRDRGLVRTLDIEEDGEGEASRDVHNLDAI